MNTLSFSSVNTVQTRRPNSTYVLHMSGNAMRKAGIFSGDQLVVDRSLTPKHGDVVVAVVEGRFLVRRLGRIKGIWCLVEEDSLFSSTLRVTSENTAFLGVVTHTIAKKRTA